ncbi:MAG: prolipoprotein diacylglyceryl transferase [Clostridia bacterium]|nr:prolipoprotein diacylglyceryl transferase [Clostridia bacterium]
MHPEALFEIFGKGVYAYGVCMAVGIILCFGFLLFTMWYKKFSETSTNAVLVIGILGTAFGIFMAMLVQSILNYAKDPSKPFQLAGMTFMGGLLGGVVSFLAVWNIYVYVIGPRTKIKWLTSKDMNAGLSDALPFIPIGIAIAHAFGRFGCFWAGCCYGQEAEWGLQCAAPHGVTLPVNVIPTQLFEMCFLLLLAGVMALLYFRFKFNYNFGVYAIAYGIWRFVIEFFRDDDRGALILGLQPSQFWSILMVLVGVGYFFLQYYLLRKLMKHPELQHKEENKDKIELTEDGTPVLAQGAEVSRVVPAEPEDKVQDETEGES